MKLRPYTLVLLSAEKAELTFHNNDKRTLALGAVLALDVDNPPSGKALKAEGTYLGHQESSYAIRLYAPISERLTKLKNIAFNVFDQDSILVVGVDNKARLVFSDEREEELGTWTETPDIEEGKDWTKIGVRTFTIT